MGESSRHFTEERVPDTEATADQHQIRSRHNLSIISLSKLKDYMPQSQTAALSSSRPNLLENLHESDIYENYVRARYGRNNLVLDNDSSPYSTVNNSSSSQSVARNKFINLKLNKNNMTPSSLLLLQNHNYIDQEQQQHRSVNDYNESSRAPRTSASEYFMSHGDSATRGADLTTSSDTTTDNRDSQHANYLSQQTAREVGRQDDRKSVTNSSVRFSQYDTINNPSSDATYQHSNFTQPMSEQHHQSSADKHDGTTTSNNRIVFEDANSTSTTGQSSNLQSGNQSQSNLIATARRNQVMTNFNLCYGTNSHYNLMPTPSSKSTSPTSSNSTPSPKTSVMHATSASSGTGNSGTGSSSSSSSSGSSNNNNNNNSNGPRPNHHIIASALANSSTSASQAVHLDHLNQHYVNESMLSGSSLQQHHHNVAHNYTYANAPTSSSNLHLAMSNHDQQYSHHQINQSVPQQQQQQHQQMQQQQQQQQHHHQQQQHHQQQHHQQQSIQTHQAIYQHMAHNTANVGVNHIYGNHGNTVHYQGHLQAQAGNSGQIVPGAHQSHLNTAAAARAAAAVVSQTLKTVTNHQGQHSHHYGSSIANSLSATPGSIMNHITAPHHQHQFHTMDQVGHSHHMASHHHHLTTNQAQQPPLSTSHNAASIVTRKYQCKMCPQVFMSKAEMKYHNQNHMREAKPYKCLQCPKAFANSSYLSQHMRIHQGVKPYTCDICSRKFTQLSHLQQHKRTHTGDKPYKCTYMNCTKQFSQLSNLQSHSRCHQLDKPYKCNSCYKCFHDEQSLLEHIPRHLESKHLKKNLCIFCGSSYQQERGLVKHFQQYHTDKSPTLVAAAIAAGTTGNTSLIASLISTSTSTNSFHPSATVGGGGGGGNNIGNIVSGNNM